MASDEESTQPIDIEALRKALPEKPASPATDAPLPSFADPEAPETDPDAVGTDPPSALDEDAADHTAIGRSPFDAMSSALLPGGPFGTEPPGPDPEDTHHGQTPRSLAALTQPHPHSITQPNIPSSLKATLPAHELAQALVAVMGKTTTPSSDGRFGDTDESEHTLGGATGEMPAFLEEDDGEDADTATRLPVAPPLITPESIDEADAVDATAHGVSIGTADASSRAMTSITSVSAGALSPPPISVREHPADDPDATAMGRLDRADVRVMFAAAEASESTAIRASPLLASEQMAMSVLETPQAVEVAPQSEPSIVDVDDAELESVRDLHELAATGESAILADLSSDDDEEGATADTGVIPAPPMVAELRDAAAEDEEEERTEDPLGDSGIGIPRPPLFRSASSPSYSASGSHDEPTNAGDELPRFAMPSVDDGAAMSVDSMDGDVEIVSGSVSVPRVPVATPFETERPPPSSSADEGPADRTLAAPAPKRSAAPPPPPPANVPPFQPPAPAGKLVVPAYEVDTDNDEDQLQREDGWHALLELYRLRHADADSPIARATLLHKMASVHEYRLGELEQAFDLLVQAFDQRPGDEDLAISLDRVGKQLGRVGELAERARKNLHTADLELKVILLGHLVYWYERVLGRGGEISPYVAEIERLDKTHPVALRRQAQIAAANADLKTQRDLLVRALDRTFRRDEKVALLIALAGSHAGTPEAARHYESALALDSGSVIALQGFERLGREQGKHAQVEWTLQRQVDVAPTIAERIDALLKLADLYETKYLRRERAAEMLEAVIEEEPAQPQALKGLERCYHALRDWPKLVKVLRARADNTYDKKQKTELLELAAEVFESKLGDAASAIEVHRDLLIVDPKHRRALGDLARLYEKLGDWGNMATYKARVAELSPSKRQASQLLVQLGDFLMADGRDAIAARLQYERAVVIDPTNASGWEALQRVAAAVGDDRRVVQCLEQRARHVDGPRQRAAVYVELAALHARNGDERAAREAYETAVQSDETNEAAAAAMLDAYTREEKWAEAAPLCELLVNAATRDKDDAMLFTRLRLSTRISAALGDAERAMSSAIAALEKHPEDEGAQADLVAVCMQCRNAPAIVGRAKDWIASIVRDPRPLPTTMLLGLGVLQRDAADIDGATHTLERAIANDPEHPEVLRELVDTYLAQGDYPRACKLKVDMARNATSADGRFQILCDAGEIWAKRAGELDRAAAVFEEARRIKPLDSWLLHTLMWVYSEAQRWDPLSSVLESIAQLHESPDRKAKSFFAMAQIVLEKMRDPRRAAELFDAVLDVDRARLDAFEQQVRAITEAKDWELLERAYRKMIARVQNDDDANLKFVLFQQLGLIYRDRLEDASRAYEALDAAARIRPENAEVRRIVTELLVVTDNLDNAVQRIRQLIGDDPHDADLYAELYELFLRQHYFDKAWCAVNVLAQMREATPEQRRFHEDYAPMPLAEVPGQIVEQAWRSHVLHEDLDPTLTSLFALMTPAVARMRFAQLRPDQLVYAAGRPFTPAHSRLYEAIRTTVANAAEILHLPPPDLLLGDPTSPIPFAPALAPYGAVHIAVPAVEARAESLVYVIGKRIAEQRVELAARAFFPAVSDLTALLAAAVRVSRQEGAKDAAGRALDASFSAVLNPQEREGIRSIVMQRAMEGGLVDVKRWSQAADISSMRAGLLLCGDVAQARRVILAEPQSTADLPPREKVGELYKFATSDLYSDLRGAIGVAVQE